MDKQIAKFLRRRKELNMYKKKCYLCKWAYSIYLLLQMADALSLDSATVEDFILGDDKVR